MKRTNYISWDEYFMGVALLAAQRSKDPNTQVGACIVSQDNIILSTGYNGLPNGCSDDEFPWERQGEECAKAIIQSGIREVIYLSDKYADTDNVRASKRMLHSAGVTYRQLDTQLEEISLSFSVDAG